MSYRSTYRPRADIRAEAYRRLGVDPNSVAMSPHITPLLRKLPGGEHSAIDLIRASSQDDARRFMFHYDDLTLPKTYKDLLPIEAFCIAANVEPQRLLGIIFEMAHRQGAVEGAMLAAAAHPRIVQVSINEALKPEGFSDREHNLKHMGFLPSPKGSQVNVQVNATANAQQANLAPSPEDSIRRLQDQFSEGRRTLHAAENASAAMLPETIEAEVIPQLNDLRERELDAMAPVPRKDEQ